MTSTTYQEIGASPSNDVAEDPSVQAVLELGQRYPTTPEDLSSWLARADALGAITEAEGYRDLEEMVRASDLIVAGRITSVRQRRHANPDVEDIPGAPEELQSTQYIVSVVASSPDPGGDLHEVVMEYMPGLGDPAPSGAVILFLRYREDISTPDSPVYRPVSSQGIATLDADGAIVFPMPTASPIVNSLEDADAIGVLSQIFRRG